MKEAYIVWISLISLITCIMFYTDKKNAIKGKWRVKETTLLLLCMIGGGAGGIAGMYLFHHKTRHVRFLIFVPLSICLWFFVGLFVFLH